MTPPAPLTREELKELLAHRSDPTVRRLIDQALRCLDLNEELHRTRPLSEIEAENIRLQSQLAAARGALEKIADLYDEHPANSEYDRGVRAAHMALGKMAKEVLAKLEVKG